MSRLYGTLKGDRPTTSTRCSFRGLITHAAGWRGAIRVSVSASDNGSDYYLVELVPWKNSGGKSRVLAMGKLDAALGTAVQSPAVTDAWLEQNPDYTCGCGLSVHPSKRNPRAIHIAGCQFDTHVQSDAALKGEKP